VDKYIETLEETLLVPGLIDGKYRYLDTLSYSKGESIYNDRSEDDSELRQESGTYIKESDDVSDYTECVTFNQISDKHPHKILFSIEPETAQHWGHKSIYRTGNFINGEQPSDRFIWCDDVPFAINGTIKMNDQLPGEDMWQLLFSGNIDQSCEGNYLYTGSDLDGEIFTKFYIYRVTKASGDWHSIVAKRIEGDIDFSKNTFSWIGSETVKNRPISCIVEGDSFGKKRIILNDRFYDTKFTLADEKTIVYMENGCTILIKDVLKDNNAYIEFLEGTPSYDVATQSYLGLLIEPHERVYNDINTDEKLLGRAMARKSLYYLQTRQYMPLPNSNFGCVKDGFIFVNEGSSYKYSSFKSPYRMGYFLDGYQSGKSKSGEIIDFSEMREGVLVIGVNYIAFLDTSTYQDAGEPDSGEYIPFLYGLNIISELYGKMPNTNILSILDSDTKAMICSDKKIRTITNGQISENIGSDIQRINLDKLQNQATIAYDTTNGLYLWSIER